MHITAALIGKGLLTLFCVFFAFQLLFDPTPWIFVDNFNLLVHEAGHLMFGVFGQFIGIMGGSLAQILLPVIFLVYFALRKELYSVSVMFFWVANNILNVSVYIKDAQRMQLPLLGGEGVIHDWNWLLSQLGLLDYTNLIGGTVFVCGAILLILSLFAMIASMFFEGHRM